VSTDIKEEVLPVRPVIGDNAENKDYRLFKLGRFIPDLTPIKEVDGERSLEKGAPRSDEGEIFGRIKELLGDVASPGIAPAAPMPLGSRTTTTPPLDRSSLFWRV